MLLIDGARQGGKTYIIRHAGKKLFENFIEINMVEDELGDRLFANTKTTAEREVSVKGKITYLPIYYIMFFQADGNENVSTEL